jgi:hypothetical protein
LPVIAKTLVVVELWVKLFDVLVLADLVVETEGHLGVAELLFSLFEGCLVVGCGHDSSYAELLEPSLGYLWILSLNSRAIAELLLPPLEGLTIIFRSGSSEFLEPFLLDLHS